MLKNLFKIPKCMKENFKKNKYNDYKEALKITGYFFLKILENNKFKFIFRNQIINKLEIYSFLSIHHLQNIQHY